MKSDKKQKLTLDEIDQAIINEYFQHPKAGYATVARAVKASEATVRRRVKALTKADILQFTVVLGQPAAASYFEFIIGVRADGHRVEEIAEALQSHPRIRFLAIAVGSFDLVIAAAVKTMDDWATLRREIARQEGVRSTESLVLTDILKRASDGYEPEEIAAGISTTDDSGG